MRKVKISRAFILSIVFILLFLVLIVRLFQLQIVKGEEYKNNFLLQARREIRIPGTRGNIYDRNGKPLATNKIANSVIFEDQDVYTSDRKRQLCLNSKIYKMVLLIKENGDTIESSLKIIVDQNGNYKFSVDDFWLQRFKADVYGKANIEDMEDKEKNATADEMISFLSDKFCVFSEGNKDYTDKEKKIYGLPERYEKSDLLDILNIRYSLSLQTYQKYLSVTVAKDVSDETVAAIMENQYDILGVDVKQESIRVYDGGEASSSILGYTGTISSEELKKRNNDKFNINSIVGKSGMEEYLDQYLQGQDGKREIYVDNMGRTTHDLGIIEEPKVGKDVYLSIDVELQQKIYEILERKIADILVQHLINTKTFDKTAILDSVEIKIPIYDAYIALLINGAVDWEQLRVDDASGLEKKVLEIFFNKKIYVIQEIQKDLKEASVKYGELGDEKKEYQKFIIDNLNFLNVENTDLDKKWQTGELSIKEYLEGQIGQGNIDLEIIRSKEEYLNKDEIYKALVSYIVDELQVNIQFDKIINKYLVLDDEILPEDIIKLLYEQQFLNSEDEDFKNWQSGIISTFELVISKIQKLEITPADLALDPCSGSAVVTDTKTGKVLACVSYPGYDSNRLANQMDNNYYYKIYNNASLPLYNSATQQLSAPGSTFKPVTIIAGLEEGVINGSTMVECDGVFDKVEPPLKCWNHMGHGAVNGVVSALENSCNDYLCEVSYRLGMIGNEKFSDKQALNYIQDYAKLFDLDKKSGIELTESKPQITDSYAIPSAIGQGTNNFSTVQLGRYVTTLANEGTSFQLSLIDKIDGVKTNVKVESTIELEETSWEGVHAGMESYAQSTGIFNGFPISTAGKSGTAQEVKNRPDHGLYIGYAPAENPEIAVAVRIVNGYVAGNAVECGKEIFEHYFGIE